MSRYGFALLAAAVLSLGLTACSFVPAGDGGENADTPASVAIRSYPGLPPTAPESVPIGEGPIAMWVESGSVFAVTIWGSSGCPLVPTELSALAVDAVGIHFEDSPEEMCTSDLAAMSHEFALPGSVTERPVMIAITYGSSDEIQTLLLD